MSKLMRKRTAVRTAAILAVAGVLMAACGSDDEETTASTSATTSVESTETTTEPSTETTTGVETTDVPSTEVGTTTPTTEAAGDDREADPDATLRVAIGFGYNTLDPHAGPSSGMNWQYPLYDTLLQFDQSASTPTLAPMLATSWELSDDGLSLSLELRDDVMFQDGTPFNGDAVKANVERAKSMASDGAARLANVESVEVIDDTHVVMSLSQADPGLPINLAITSAGAMISPAAFTTDLEAVPVGSGPYTLVSAQKNGDVVYERWDGYWDEDAALAKQIIISTVTDVNAAYNGLTGGSYDVAALTYPVDVDAQENYAADGYHFEVTPAQNQFGLNLNTSMAPFDDVRVRQAVYMAIDRDTISTQLFDGLAPPAYQMFWPGQVGYDESLDGLVPYDPEKAKGLIEEAGATGATVTLLSQGGVTEGMVAVVQQALTDIGLSVEVVPTSNSEVFGLWPTGANNAWFGPLGAGLDPSSTMSLCCLPSTGQGRLIGDPPADLVDMAAAAKALPVGSPERQTAYEDISSYLVGNPLHVPVVGFWSTIAGAPNVIGTELTQPVNLGYLNFRNVGIANG